MSYPVNITNVELSKSVFADIVVTLTNNRQNAVVTFITSACTIGFPDNVNGFLRKTAK